MIEAILACITPTWNDEVGSPRSGAHRGFCLGEEPGGKLLRAIVRKRPRMPAKQTGVSTSMLLP